MLIKLQFYGFLGFFGTFAHKIAPTRFVLHETWHTTLFSVYYCFEVVRIQNHIHMPQITCYVTILNVFKCFSQFRAQSDSNLVCFARNFAHNSIWYIFLC